MGSKAPIKLAVCGDTGVGKTSLVVALANESFPASCLPVMPPVTMPADYLPDGMPFEVIDTCTRPEERAVLEQVLLSVDAVLLLYVAASIQSLKRIETHWLPELKRMGVEVPIILVASKIDLTHQDVDEISATVQPIMLRHKGQIESLQQCSAKTLKNVTEVFYYGVKSVINPVAPIFNPQASDGEGALTSLCIKALKRIFIINDVDKDGALNDEELSRFQMDVFSAPLQPEELHGLHQMVSAEMPQGVTPAGLALPGFLFLHALFIEKGTLETVWAVLRRYGYNNELLLDEEVLNEVNFTHSPDQVIEMTETCISWLKEKFADFDKDGNLLLDAFEQADMFSSAPDSLWKDEEYRSLLVDVGTSGQDDSALTLSGFLSKWAYTTAADPVRALAYIRYMGYVGPASSLFRISKPRRQERSLMQLQRNIVKGLVVLGGRAGQRSMLKALSSTPMGAELSDSCVSAAGEVSGQLTTSGERRTLILTEADPEDLLRMKQDQSALQSYDLALFTFSGNSLESLREAEKSMMELAEASGNTLPCVLVNYDDGQDPTQATLEEYGRLIAALDLRQPLEISNSSVSDLSYALEAALQIAEDPEKVKTIPQTPSLKAKKESQRMLRRSLYILGGGVIAGAAAYAVYRAFQTPSEESRLPTNQAAGINNLSEAHGPVVADSI